jgi:hypothetical protein
MARASTPGPGVADIYASWDDVLTRWIGQSKEALYYELDLFYVCSPCPNRAVRVPVSSCLECTETNLHQRRRRQVTYDNERLEREGTTDAVLSTMLQFD